MSKNRTFFNKIWKGKEPRLNFQIFGGTLKYFGGTSGFRGTQVEKHWVKGY
jgi:hypothetical protein